MCLVLYSTTVVYCNENAILDYGSDTQDWDTGKFTKVQQLDVFPWLPTTIIALAPTPILLMKSRYSGKKVHVA